MKYKVVIFLILCLNFLCIDMKGCIVWSEGKYIIYFVGFICVGYNISFYFNKILIIKLKDFLCYIEMFLIDERF